MSLVSEITTPEVIMLNFGKLVLTPFLKWSERTAEAKKRVFEEAKRNSSGDVWYLYVDYLAALSTKQTYKLQLNRIEDKLQYAN